MYNSFDTPPRSNAPSKAPGAPLRNGQNNTNLNGTEDGMALLIQHAATPILFPPVATTTPAPLRREVPGAPCKYISMR